jgi:hypothetical protein
VLVAAVRKLIGPFSPAGTAMAGRQTAPGVPAESAVPAVLEGIWHIASPLAKRLAGENRLVDQPEDRGSPVWKFFKIDKKREYGRVGRPLRFCCLCRDAEDKCYISCPGSNTSSMTKHLRRRHQPIWAERLRECGIDDQPDDGSTDSQVRSRPASASCSDGAA